MLETGLSVHVPDGERGLESRGDLSKQVRGRAGTGTPFSHFSVPVLWVDQALERAERHRGLCPWAPLQTSVPFGKERAHARQELSVQAPGWIQL